MLQRNSQFAIRNSQRSSDGVWLATGDWRLAIPSVTGYWLLVTGYSFSYTREDASRCAA